MRHNMKWINLTAGDSIGFNTAAEAEAFLFSQSTNPAWLAQFTIEYSCAYDKLQCILRVNHNVSLNFG